MNEQMTAETEHKIWYDAGVNDGFASGIMACVFGEVIIVFICLGIPVLLRNMGKYWRGEK